MGLLPQASWDRSICQKYPNSQEPDLKLGWVEGSPVGGGLEDLGCGGVHGLWASSGLGLLTWKMGVIGVIIAVWVQKKEKKKGTQHRDDWRGA